MPGKEKLRIDKYLWAVRIFKTRSLAAEACSSGKVKCEGKNVKAAKAVNIGETYEIKTVHNTYHGESKKWVIQVVALLHNRVQFSEAIKYYMDLTPEKTIEKVQASSFIFNTGKRKSKQGRPTKKEKRDLDDFKSL